MVFRPTVSHHLRSSCFPDRKRNGRVQCRQTKHTRQVEAASGESSSVKLKTRPEPYRKLKESSKSTVSRLLQIDDKKQKQLIEQLALSRNRMSHRLSEANKYISFLEHQMEERNHSMHEAYRVMQKVIDELDALSNLTVTVAASLKFGVDEQESLQKLTALQKRLDNTHLSLKDEKKIIYKNSPRRVPISWIGVAQEVRVMGSFDGWTMGKELSAEEISEHVISEFTGVLELLPGRYEFKLVVNDEWRLADTFPTVTHDSGVTNNVLIVE